MHFSFQNEKGEKLIRKNDENSKENDRKKWYIKHIYSDVRMKENVGNMYR